MNILNFMPKVIAIENDFCLRTSAIWQFVGYGLFALKIAIPLIIIIFGIIDFAKAVASSDDKAIKNASMSLFRRLLVGICIFFVPTIVAVVFNLIDNVADLDGLTECEECLFNPTSATCEGYIQSAEEKRREEADAISDIRVVEDSDGNNGETPSSGDGDVLILAGHSYSPYCGKVNNECRGVWPSSGYDETTETRKLARVLKSSLSAVGVEAGNRHFRILLFDGFVGRSQQFHVFFRRIFKRNRFSVLPVFVEKNGKPGFIPDKPLCDFSLIMPGEN